MKKLIMTGALVCKIIAALAWFGMAWVKVSLDLSDLLATSQPMYRDAPEDWGTPAFYWRTSLEIVVVCGCFVLSALPNRWLVSRRPIFWGGLIFSLVPLVGFAYGFRETQNIHDIFWVPFVAVMLSPLLIFLPLSLILSRWRHGKGEKVTYV